MTHHHPLYFSTAESRCINKRVIGCYSMAQQHVVRYSDLQVPPPYSLIYHASSNFRNSVQCAYKYNITKVKA
jgi:hypothetical protein